MLSPSYSHAHASPGVRLRDEVVFEAHAATYVIPKTASAPQEQCARLAALLPGTLSVYIEHPNACVKVFEKLGMPSPMLPSFAACFDGRGWRAICSEDAGWQPSCDVRGAQTAKDAIRHATTSAGHSSLFRACVEHSSPARKAKRTETFDSLLACFLLGGGVQGDGQTRHSPDNKIDVAASAAAQRTAAFIQRQDLLQIALTQGQLPSLYELFSDEAASLPTGSPVRSSRARFLSASVQLGLMRYMTDATLSVYAAVPHRNATTGARTLAWVKTFERLGIARGSHSSLAVGHTAAGWLPLRGASLRYHNMANFPAPRRLVCDGSEPGPLPVREIAAELASNRAPQRYFASLLDAYMLGGGLVLNLPESISHHNQVAHVTWQLDVFASRYEACLQLQTEEHAQSWGDAARCALDDEGHAFTDHERLLAASADVVDLLPLPQLTDASSTWLGTSLTQPTNSWTRPAHRTSDAFGRPFVASNAAIEADSELATGMGALEALAKRPRASTWHGFKKIRLAGATHAQAERRGSLRELT